MIVDPGGPWIRLSRDDLAPVLAPRRDRLRRPLTRIASYVDTLYQQAIDKGDELMTMDAETAVRSTGRSPLWPIRCAARSSRA